MIKKRLVGLLSHAKKYIVYQVVWQWLALLCQILLIFCGTALLAEGLSGESDSAGDPAESVLRKRSLPGFLPGLYGCEADPAG